MQSVSQLARDAEWDCVALPPRGAAYFNGAGIGLFRDAEDEAARAAHQHLGGFAIDQPLREGQNCWGRD